MEHLDWRPAQKPYDLRERLFEFACLIVRVAQFLHTRGSIAVALSDQLLRCGLLTAAQEPVVGESDELVKIMATVIKNAEANRRAPERSRRR